MTQSKIFRGTFQGNKNVLEQIYVDLGQGTCILRSRGQRRTGQRVVEPQLLAHHPTPESFFFQGPRSLDNENKLLALLSLSARPLLIVETLFSGQRLRLGRLSLRMNV